jgi:hypothetical protein
LESRDHLFFHCSFNRQICREIMRRSFMDTLPISWDEVLDWSIKELEGGGLRKLLRKLSLGSAVYNL